MTEGLWSDLAATFSIGLLGSAHCLGMCGGIASALNLASENSRVSLLIAYNSGRLLSYGAAGGLVASLGYFGANYLNLSAVLRGLAGLLLIAMGLYLANWWRGLSFLEQAGAALWRQLQPLGRNLLPLRSLRSAVLLGLLWGWLPCGLVYTALAYSATATSPLSGILVMLAFGLGTIPAIILGGASMGRLVRLLRSRGLRFGFAMLFVIYGLWTLIAAQSFFYPHH